MSSGNKRATAVAACVAFTTTTSCWKRKALVEELRNSREYELMGQLAEAVSRVDPKDVRNRRLYAQYLIETGKATAAVELLKPLTGGWTVPTRSSPRRTGLLGRAYKQMFFDAGDKTSAAARDALKQAIAMYRAPLEHDPAGNSWHGVNLLALLTRARRLGMQGGAGSGSRPRSQGGGRGARARSSGTTQRVVPADAGGSVARSGGLERRRAGIRAYAGREKVPVRSWSRARCASSRKSGISSPSTIAGARWSASCALGLAELPGGGVELEPAQLQRLQGEPSPRRRASSRRCWAAQGPETYRWWKTGMDRALSVAAVYQRKGDRIGTGFLVRASDSATRRATSCWC